MKLTKKGVLTLFSIFVLSSLLNTTFLIWFSSHLLSSHIDNNNRYHSAEQSIFKKHIISSVTSKGIDNRYNYISLINDPREAVKTFFLDKKGKIIGSHSLSDNLQEVLRSIISQLNDRRIPCGYIVTKEKIPVYFELINDSYWLVTLSYSPIVDTSTEVSHLIFVSITYSVIVNIFLFMILLFYLRNKALYQVDLVEEFKDKIKLRDTRIKNKILYKK